MFDGDIENYDFIHTYWDLKVCVHTQPTNQKSERLRKYIIRPIRDTNDSASQRRATSAKLSIKTEWKKTNQDLLSLKDQ